MLAMGLILIFNINLQCPACNVKIQLPKKEVALGWFYESQLRDDFCKA